MNTIILKTASRFLLPLLLLFSVFLLLRGHYLPGGGFVGGLVASIAFVLHAFAYDLESSRRLLRIHPGYLIPIGMSVALLSGIFPVVFQDLPFMTGIWYPDSVPVIGSIGTALFFDAGVYIVVVGSVLTIIMTLSESS
ncbi:MAG: Na+/H+ antiporter subunit B [Cryomorphaceae bacterium]|nr:Na+/H+ antiporter subunit B [Flavobacteriales bacterium]